MNKNQGGSEQGQDNGFKPTVTWHKNPGYFYENSKEQQGTEDEYDEMGGVTPNALESTGLHRGAEVSQVDLQNTKEKMTTIAEDTNDETTKDTVRNDGVGVDVSQRDAVNKSSAIKDWKSTLSEEEIAKAFDGGAADDYNGSGIVPVNLRNEGNLQSPVENLGNLREEIDVVSSGDRGAELPDDVKLSGGSTNEQIPEYGSTKGPENESVKLGQDEKITLPEKGAEEVAKLEKERDELRNKLNEKKIILDKLLVDKRELDEQTKFLGIGSEAADSLVKEIRIKEDEVNKIGEDIAKIEQQITEINQTPEQVETQTQEKTEVATQTPLEDVVKTREKNIVRKENDLIKGSDDGITEKKQVSEGLDRVMEISNVESVENEEVVYKIKNGQTLLETIKEGILMLGVDKDETDGMGLKALGEFKVEQLKKNITKNIAKGMPKNMAEERALSSWGEALDKLKSGDKVIVSLSRHGVELDIPVISNSKLNMGRTMNSNNVADDYNYAQAA